MNKLSTSGFTLVELLIVIVILGVIATVTLPLLSSGDPQKLSVAAEETANTLRFALSEAAKRTGGSVLVDGKTTPGHLLLYYSTSSANLPPTAGVSAINDPLTKITLDLNPASNPFSQGVTLTPQFRAGGNAQPQLLIGPGLSQMQGFNGAGAYQGPLQANSGALLSLGTQSTLVSLNPVTGLVTLP